MPANFVRAAFLGLLLAVAAAGPGYAADQASGAGRLWTEVPAAHEKLQAPAYPDFVDLAAKLGPAVVNVSVEEAKSPASELLPGQGGSGAYGPPFHRHDLRGLGSGFIISRGGYVLTNQHVVENADKILVSTRDGHRYHARLVGADAKTDVALLKIDAHHPLPVAPLGDSDSVRVGQWVLAVGNPFGFDHTVTAGIVSAKGRFIPGSYDDFIQTDAAINPGNSGGPLIDLSGAVVGVNSAIYTRTGASAGIGFAIPINLVKEELAALAERGRVVRGWLGIYIEEVKPEAARRAGLPEPHGAMVDRVLEGGPAKAAGLRPGDIIVALDGHPIASSQELPLAVGRVPLGRTVELSIVRGTKPMVLRATIAAAPDEQLASGGSGGGPPAPGSTLGLQVKNPSAELSRELALPRPGGVVVYSVRPGSPAYVAGLRARDVILEVNRQPIADVGSYAKALSHADKGAALVMLVRRGDKTVFVPVRALR